MIIKLTITGFFTILLICLGYSDWHHSRLPDDEAAHIKYSSPEFYIISILGILAGTFFSLGLKITVIVFLLLLPFCYIFLRKYSPYFEFLPPRF